MKKVTKVVLLFIAMLLTITCSLGNLETNVIAASRVKELHAEEIFHGVPGTTVIKNLRTNKTYAYNLQRSNQRFTPESSFKVPNALIGLEEHAVEDEYEVKRWDGVIREFEVWNQTIR
ncbi:penicillin binding protein [Cohnella lupini]|uniref:Beta-lactamase n=1 Tax=Cohnella lupini TaxID=1294267 RepID=A0A3D9ISY0_9BACL|nr:penicillin binding protein [Cohnella lupini]